MAEALTNHFDHSVPATIADMIVEVHPAFDQEAFLTDALTGYEPLGLMDRGRKISQSMRRYLPECVETSLQILVRTFETRGASKAREGHLASFLFLPHSFYISSYGLDHFEPSMRAQYYLTQHFTAEYSIRPFLERYPAATLGRLEQWIEDPSHHVRRLVSEGTRPRLPWASHLPRFVKDPQPVLALLERLKDDPHEYVRRSVANNLNDIGKDHPHRLLDTTERWLADASENRRRLIRHALRSMIKQGDRRALTQMGYGKRADVMITDRLIEPDPVLIGESLTFSCRLCSRSDTEQQLLVDFCIEYRKADGSTRSKVFKLKTLDLAPGETVPIRKTVSFRQLSTRTHYPGDHSIDLLVNGEATPLGVFRVEPAGG